MTDYKVPILASGGLSPSLPVFTDSAKSLVSKSIEDTLDMLGLVSWGQNLGPWAGRKRFALPIPTADLVDFPAKVPIVAGSPESIAIGALCLATGYDIRFTAADGTTLLSYERESFAVAGGEASGIFWVKTDVAMAGTYIWCYYGNAAAADVSNGPAVFGPTGSGHAAVYHMNDLTTSTILDSTGNANNGTKAGANEPVEANGKIWKGQDFDGGNDYIDIGAGASLDMESDNFVFEAWVYAHDFDNGKNGIIGAESGGAGLSLTQTNGNLNLIKVDAGDAPSSAGAVPATTWTHVAAVFNSNIAVSNLTYYINGAPDSTVTFDFDFTAGAGSRYLGSIYDWIHRFDGVMDEVRISLGTLRSAEWIAYEYANMNPADGGLTWGAEEYSTMGPAGPTGATGSASNVPGPTGPASTVTGPTGSMGPTGPGVTVIASDAATPLVTISQDTEKTTSSTSYAKLKEMRFNAAAAGTIQFQYSVHSASTGDVQTAWYKNGVLVAEDTVHTGTGAEIFYYSFTGIAANDLIQVYGKRITVGNACHVINFRAQYKWVISAIGGKTLTASLSTTDTTVISTTNQDP
jgi:hypothetical protein